MTDQIVLDAEPLNIDSGMRPYPRYGYPTESQLMQSAFRLQWKLDQNIGPSEQATVASGRIDFSPEGILSFGNRLAGLMKLERQHRERLAAVSLDPSAQKLLSALDRETSIMWEDLPDRAECDWTEASRSAVLLAGANLCEASPTRIRLSEYGDKLLAESSPTG